MITKALVENVTEVMLNFTSIAFITAIALSALGERGNVIGEFGLCRKR